MVIYFTVYRRSSIFDSHPLLLGGGAQGPHDYNSLLNRPI